MTNRVAMIALLGLGLSAIAGCENAEAPAKRQLDAVRGTIDTSYRGPADEKLTPQQRAQLRQRGDLQR